MARLEDELMTSLLTGDSVFRFIPDNIGEIVYCDSSNPKAEPDTKEQTRNKLILSIVIPLAITIFCWLVFNESHVFDIIVTVLMVIIGYICVENCLNFKGTDYFVGTEGAAIVKFDKTRENLVSKKMILFNSVSDLLTGETRKYRNRSYEGTDYYFVIYGHEENNQKKVIASVASSYKQEKPGNYYTDQLYRFWKKVESNWSQYKLSQLKAALNNGEAIGFNLYAEKSFANDYIMFKGKEMDIGGKIYNRDNIKDIKFDNGNLIIVDVNHESKFFGLIQKGDKETIPLHNIGNRELFLTFFQYFASTL